MWAVGADKSKQTCMGHVTDPFYPWEGQGKIREVVSWIDMGTALELWHLESHEGYYPYWTENAMCFWDG